MKHTIQTKNKKLLEDKEILANMILKEMERIALELKIIKFSITNLFVYFLFKNGVEKSHVPEILELLDYWPKEKIEIHWNHKGRFE